jgi:hypothetical protein
MNQIPQVKNMMFKDSFGFKDGEIVFKTDCSSWASVFMHNLSIEKYMFYKSHNPLILTKLGFKESKKNVKVKRVYFKDRLRTKRKKNLTKTRHIPEDIYDDIYLEFTKIPLCKHCGVYMVNSKYMFFSKETKTTFICFNDCHVKLNEYKRCYLCLFGKCIENRNVCEECRDDFYNM